MEVKITIPQNLDEVKLKTMLEWLSLPDDMPIEEKHDKALRLFANLPAQVVRKLQAKQRKELLTKIHLAINSNPDFRPRFTHKGVMYGFEPNLDEMTFGQFIDIDTIKDYQADLGKLMAILYRPVTSTLAHTYEIEPYKALDDVSEYEEMPAGVAFGMLLFFWTIGNKFLSDTQSFTELQGKQSKHIEMSPKNGDGTHTFTACAAEILEDLTTLLRYDITPRCFGLPMRPMWRAQINLQVENLTTKV